ncbi:hypothetical protein [Nostoc sp. JL23]|uniref:hypothetical protein n=1 Tax=Nostoc sp. JL23 TaxID=2815394 RepID=UPI001DB30AAC|nr:hypothetical protein [Nostoc sp. JL23]MBN3875253.1 hypothetical protein [Nostoc sp. JL23]
MPRSTIANRRAIQFDKATELRDYAAAAISASTTETALFYAVTKLMDYKAVVDVAAHTGFVATTAQWDITVEAGATSGGTYKTVGTFTSTGVANRFDVPLSGEWVDDIVADAAYIRVKAVKTGSPGNLTYGAFLIPCC